MKSKISFRNLINGICIGISNIIPGVSGGTTAVVLGIYEKLIESISGLKSNFKENMMFLLQIGIGAGIGIVAFSGIISMLLEKYTIAVNYLFVGLVLGSVSMIVNKVENKKISPNKIIGFIIGLTLVMLISIVGGKLQETSSVTNSATQNLSYLALGFAGFMTALTMILPGVSGSLTLVMLGLYDDFTKAIATFNIPYLIAGAIGGIVGLIVTVKIVSYLLKHYSDTTYSAILGLVVGSIFVIIMANPMGQSWLIALITVFVGALFTTMVSKKFS